MTRPNGEIKKVEVGALNIQGSIWGLSGTHGSRAGTRDPSFVVGPRTPDHLSLVVGPGTLSFVVEPGIQAIKGPI